MMNNTPVNTSNSVTQELKKFQNNIADSAISLSTNPGVWLSVGVLLYQWITKPIPLSDHDTDVKLQDLKRYNKMCALYLAVLKKDRIPPQWELKDGCPTHDSRLSGSAENFRVMARSLRDSSYPLKINIAKTIASIERLYESLSKRSSIITLNWKKYRPDGYEAMFFADLAQWLSADLPAASIIAQTTADMLKARIDYCEAVEKEVFIYRDDTHRNNPKNRLKQIIENLKTLHQDICKSIEAASFNAQIDAINNHLLDMTTHAFDICHLILKDVNQMELQVDEFLRPNPSNHKVLRLTQLLMGQWIKLTLEKAGVTSNNFQDNGKVIDIEAIESHLNIDLKTILLENTGLLDFILNDKDKTPQQNEKFAHDVLLKVILIHREILNIYHVRSSLFHAARVSVNLGENWLYGNEDGRVVIQSLLSVIKDASDRFVATLNDFWTLFYTNGFHPYAEKNNLDCKDPTYNYLENANKRIKNISMSSANINMIIDVLGTKAKLYQNDQDEIKKTRRILITNLYEYMRRRANMDTGLVNALKKMADREGQSSLTPPPQIITQYPEVIDQYVVRFPKSQLELYATAKRLLSAQTTSSNLKLMPRPKNFHTLTQKRLYDEFLVPYHRIVHSGFFYSLLYNFTLCDMSKLGKLYSSVNTIMTKLYDDDVIRQNSRIMMTEDDHESLFFHFQKKYDENLYWSTQMMLIDQLFKIAMLEFSNQCPTHSFNMLLSKEDFEILKVKEIGEVYEITIDQKLLTFAGGAFAMELEEAKRTLQEEKIAHEKTKKALTQSEVKPTPPRSTPDEKGYMNLGIIPERVENNGLLRTCSFFRSNLLPSRSNLPVEKGPDLKSEERLSSVYSPQP